MSFDPRSDFQELQKRVFDLLIKVSSLMQDASSILDMDETEQNYAQFHQQISNEATKVKNLELRMAIVAPMKAGKSTIVNSVIGQPVLPSRASAMTTLPTEIIFRASLTEPTLQLSSDLVMVFKDTLLDLKRTINEIQPAMLERKLGHHPHLTELVHQLQEMVGFPIPPEVTGRERVSEVLTFLNDIIRLSSLIAPFADPLHSLDSVPRIYTPFWYFQSAGQVDYLGNLVIVDTPGPNEAGEHLKLGAVVKQQLQQSSIVLIVLDFTGLNAKAAAEIKQDVQKVVEVRGQENLYVLVNKVDQRKEGDPMIPERIRQFVAADLELKGCNTEDRVFEISARRAFSASSFLQEVESTPGAAIADLKTARSLAQEVFGIDWEEEFAEATLDELKRKAERLWKKSGFAPFLDKAISALMAEAAPRCIEAALRLMRDRLIRLQNTVQLRSRAINSDEERLRGEIGALAADLEELEVCRKDLRQVDDLTKKLHKELDRILKELKATAQIELKDFFNEQEMQRADLPRRIQLNWERFVERFERRQNRSSNVIQFDTWSEAEEFIDLAISCHRQKTESLLDNVRRQVETIIERTREDLKIRLNELIQPIIQAANERLNQAFNIELTLPDPQLRLETRFMKPKIQRETKSVDQGYEERVIEKRSFWRFFYLIPYKKTIKVKRPDKQVDHFTVSLTEIVDQVNQSIEESIASLKQGVTTYLEEDFKERVNSRFDSLDSYLTSYQDNLKQAQQDQQLEAKQKCNLLDQISNLETRARDALKEISEF